MVSARYYSLCAASGLAWGGIAYFLGGQWFSAIWGGIIASLLRVCFILMAFGFRQSLGTRSHIKESLMENPKVDESMRRRKESLTICIDLIVVGFC